MSGIPLIDLRGGADAAARAIDRAMRETGFFAIVGHGFDERVVADAFDAAHRFFALSEESKRRWHIDGWPVKRGFDPIGWQSLDVGQPPDVKESFYLGHESHGPNQWPDESLVPGFRAALERYGAEALALARRTMGLFERALALPPRFFDAFMNDPICTTRLLHYPPQPAAAAPGQIGCGAHTDWGALTLLAQDETGGLQVRLADGQWFDVDPVPGSFVVNAGDMMQRWTNDAWRSTVHRVINRGARRASAGNDRGANDPGRDRWSIAYFFDLDPDVVIEPLPACVSAANPARYGPITPAAHLAEMYRRTTVTA